MSASGPRRISVLVTSHWLSLTGVALVFFAGLALVTTAGKVVISRARL
jgi:hypothetical protein